MVKIGLRYGFASFIILLAGIIIYILFRNQNLLLFHIFPKPSFLNIINFPVKTNSFLSNLFIYNLPGGLWFISGLLIIRAIWIDNQKWRITYSGIFTLLALILEISQLSLKIPGTFDLMDITLIFFIIFIDKIIFNKLIGKIFSEINQVLEKSHIIKFTNI